jgi:hypothetical protein
VLSDGIEDVLVARPENNVRAHDGRGLGDPAGGERGVPLAAAERLAAGQVPLPVMLCGRPVRMRIRVRARAGADVVAPGLTQVTGDVSDDGGVVPVRQHHDVGGTPRGGRGHVQQVRQRPDPDRAGRPGRQPPRQQDLAVRGDHDPAAVRGASVCEYDPGACRKRLRGALISAERFGLPHGVGPGHLPGILRLRPRHRYLDCGRHHEIRRRQARAQGAQPGLQLQSTQPEQRTCDRFHADSS